MSKYLCCCVVALGLTYIPITYEFHKVEAGLEEKEATLQTLQVEKEQLENTVEMLSTENENYLTEIEQLEGYLNNLKNEVERVYEENAQLEKQLLSKASSPLSSYELDLLERLVEAEAGAEPLEGRIAVAQVVLNRVASSKFPNTIEGVIYQRNQFEPVAIGTIETKVASATTKEAVDKALKGHKVVGDDILYFWAKYVPSSHEIWRSCPVVQTIGIHHFSNVWQ